MKLIPRLILHQEAAILLCGERPDGDEEAAPLTGMDHVEMGSPSDTDETSSLSSEDSSDEESFASSTAEMAQPSLSLETDFDPEEQAQCALGTPSPTSDGSLFYANDEVHVFGKTVIAVENTVVGAQNVAKKVVGGIQKVPQGTQKVAKETVKHTGRVAKETVKHTGRVAKKTGKVAKKTGKVARKTAKKTAKETERAVKKTANWTTGLPHNLRADWPHLILLLVVLGLSPVILSLPLACLTTLHPVESGLSHNNRVFLYGTHSLMDFFTQVPFIATTHYAMPNAKIPVKARIMALLVGLSVAKLTLASISEAWFHPDTVFPVPFSFIVAMFPSVLFGLFTMWLMTPLRNDPAIDSKIQKNFLRCLGLLLTYMGSLVAACAWAVKFRELSDNPWKQMGWIILYQVMEFILKIVVAGNLTTRLNPQRWLQLNFVVDLIFANVQINMLPYFASLWSVFLALFGAIFSLIVRAYGAGDRLLLFLANAKELVTEAKKPADAFRGIGAAATKMTVSPFNEIKPMSARLIGGAQRNLGASVWEIDDEDLAATGDDEESNEPKIDSLAVSDDEEACIQQPNEPKIDRRAAFANQKHQAIRNSKLEEVRQEQRHLYHVCDSNSSAILVTLVRFAAIMTSVYVRHLPRAAEHVNVSFQVSDEQWRIAIGYGFIFIFGIVFILLGAACYLRKFANLGQLKLRRIIAYIFQGSYWFFFFWFCFVQMVSLAFLLSIFKIVF